MTEETQRLLSRVQAGPTELRPPPEHADKPLHWVTTDETPPSVAVWVQDGWAFADGMWLSAAAAVKNGGYRYLGPAEWAPAGDHTALVVAGNTLYDYAARIATLEAQNARLLNHVSAAESQAARLTAENAQLRANPPMTRVEDGALYAWDADGGAWRTALGTAPAIHRAVEAATDPHATDPIGPNDEIHQRVEKTIGDLVNGSVVPKARQAIRDAVDKADRYAPPNTTGATKDKPMPGRALGFGSLA